MLDEGAHQLSLWDWSSRPVLSDHESPGSGLGIAWVTAPRLADSGSWLLGGTEATVASRRTVGVRVPPSTGVPTTGMHRVCRIHPAVQWSKPAWDVLSPRPQFTSPIPPRLPTWPPKDESVSDGHLGPAGGTRVGVGAAHLHRPTSPHPRSWAAQVPAPKADFVVERKPLRESLGTYIKIPLVMT